MTRATLLALAGRCEAAEGPDVALNADIERLLHPGLAEHPWKALQSGRPMFTGPSGHQYVGQRYTASVDAALTLVPKGADLNIQLYHDGCAGIENGGIGITGGRTLALAICVAALRLRAAMEGAP